MLLPSAAPASAQVAGNVTVATNAIFRGQTVSDDRPTVDAAVSYDSATGLFGGAVASMRLSGNLLHFNAVAQYVGYATRRGSTSLELGAVLRQYDLLSDRDYARSYVEGFVGLTRGRVNARLFASPNYARSGRATFYGEVNAPVATARGWTLAVHAGVSAVPANAGAHARLRLHPDWKAEASRVLAGRFNVAFGLARTTYPVVARSGKARLYATLSRSF